MKMEAAKLEFNRKDVAGCDRIDDANEHSSFFGGNTGVEVWWIRLGTQPFCIPGAGQSTTAINRKNSWIHYP